MAVEVSITLVEEKTKPHESKHPGLESVCSSETFLTAVAFYKQSGANQENKVCASEAHIQISGSFVII